MPRSASCGGAARAAWLLTLFGAVVVSAIVLFLSHKAVHHEFLPAPRHSWHGAEYPFHGTSGEVNDIYRRYCETLLSVDESTQRLLEFLRETKQLESTLVIYMGDNGHMWGEQHLIDKRLTRRRSASRCCCIAPS